MKNFLKEFETFAVKGNALDLAIGVVIGAAFSAITNSLVTNIITPPLGLLIGDINFSELVIPLGGTAVIGYGLFLQALLNFIIIAFALFLMVKGINRLVRKKQAEEQKENEAPKPVETEEVKVLKEIRDALQKP